jgi:Flp pilus assembly protein TadB
MPLFLALAGALLAAAFAAPFLGLARFSRLPSIPGEMGAFGRWRERLRSDLIEAGADISPSRFLFISISTSLLAGAAIALLLGMNLVGFAAAVFLGVYGFRSWYIGGRARAQRLDTTARIAEAAREIAEGIEAGLTPLEALRGYANRARPGGASAATTGRRNLVAESLALAVGRIDRGTAADESLRNAAEELGSRYFGALVEAYVANAPVSGAQLARAMMRVATETEFSIALQAERLAAIRPPATSNKMVGAVVLFILVVMRAFFPAGDAFFGSVIGQVLFVFGVLWWWFGSRLLVSGVELEF